MPPGPDPESPLADRGAIAEQIRHPDAVGFGVVDITDLVTRRQVRADPLDPLRVDGADLGR